MLWTWMYPVGNWRHVCCLEWPVWILSRSKCKQLHMRVWICHKINFLCQILQGTTSVPLLWSTYKLGTSRCLFHPNSCQNERIILSVPIYARTINLEHCACRQDLIIKCMPAGFERKIEVCIFENQLSLRAIYWSFWAFLQSIIHDFLL